MITAPRKFAIEAKETLLVVSKWPDGQMFTGDIPRFGALMTMDNVLDELNERTIRVFRFSLEKLTAEDITEEAAVAWIHSMDCYHIEITDKNRPLYVTNSMAWARWSDDVEAMTPVALKGLDHRTQWMMP